MWRGREEAQEGSEVAGKGQTPCGGDTEVYEEEHAARTAIKKISLEVAAAEAAAIRAAEARKAAVALEENGRLELQALAEVQAEIARLTGLLQDPSGGDLILAEWNGARPPMLPSFGSLAPSGPLGAPSEDAKSPAPLAPFPEVMPRGLLPCVFFFLAHVYKHHIFPLCPVSIFFSFLSCILLSF